MKQEMDVTASGLVDDPPRRRRKPFLLRRKVQRRVLPWGVIILLFALWEIVVRLFAIEQFLLPAPSAITAFLISFFPILLNVATRIATVEPELRVVLRALGASRWQDIQKVGLP